MRGRLALLVVLGALAFAYQAHAITDIVRDLRTSSGGPRAPFRTEFVAGRIARVSDEAAAAGVKAGDRRRFRGREALRGPQDDRGGLARRPAGGRPPIGVQRLGAPDEIRSVIQLEADQPGEEALDDAARGRPRIALPVVSLLLGFAVALRRPQDTRALLLLLMMMSFAQLPDSDAADEAAWGPVFRVFGAFFDQALSATWPIWMLLFAIAFPERLALDRRFPWVKWVFVGPMAVFAVMRSVGAVGAVEGVDAAARLLQIVSGLEPLPTILMMITVGSFFSILGFKGNGRHRRQPAPPGAALYGRRGRADADGAPHRGQPDRRPGGRHLFRLGRAARAALDADLSAQPRLRDRRPSRHGRARGRPAGPAIRAGPARGAGVAGGGNRDRDRHVPARCPARRE